MPNTDELPYFPFYVKDFLADDNVDLMRATEVGTYMLLLMRSWQRGPDKGLPNDDGLLAQWGRVDPAQWEAIKDRVLACWTLGDDGNWRQRRLCREYEKVTNGKVKKRKAGQAGAAARWQTHSKRNGKRIANALPPQCDTNAIQSHIQKEKYKKERSDNEEDTPPKGFPTSEDQAVKLASGGARMIPKSFARERYQTAVSRGGCDSKGVAIHDFAAHCRVNWGYTSHEQKLKYSQQDQEAKGNSPTSQTPPWREDADRVLESLDTCKVAYIDWDEVNRLAAQLIGHADALAHIEANVPEDIWKQLQAYARGEAPPPENSGAKTQKANEMEKVK